MAVSPPEIYERPGVPESSPQDSTHDENNITLRNEE
jgi:hypothetical protein